jgi:hypothetical protein
MAKSFQRYPIVGGDKNTWGTINNDLRDITIGLLSTKLYDDGGTLTITKGAIGIDNVSTKGFVNITSEETLSIAGVSNSNWANVALVFVLGSPVLTVGDLPGATDENEIPSLFLDGYDPTKGGYYLTAGTRTIGLIYKDSGGNLGKVISCQSFEVFSGEDVRGVNGYIKKINTAMFNLITTNFTTSSASYVDVAFNNTIYNSIKDCALNSGGNLEVPAGLYKVDITFNFYIASGGSGSVMQASNRLYNKSDSALIKAGAYINYPINTIGDSQQSIKTIFSLSSIKELAFQIKVSRASGGIYAENADLGGLSVILEKLDGE